MVKNKGGVALRPSELTPSTFIDYSPMTHSTQSKNNPINSMNNTISLSSQKLDCIF
ncbi:MAG: hypothetical protein V3U87_06025 [Methylococcaceae bacterium]